MKIVQDKCAMKVSTDACIQGAWTPLAPFVQNVLDIGTGTGLLSLMLAQRAKNIKITALEIDPEAAKQATENVTHSPFAQQINIIETDAKKWYAKHQFDLIVCNPPFFTKSLHGPDEQRNLARHNDQLSQKDLAEVISTNLTDDGYASVLLPATELLSWEKYAALNKLYSSKHLLIKPFSHSNANRVIIFCSKNGATSVEQEELVIYERQNIYTDVFRNLMAPFYLNL